MFWIKLIRITTVPISLEKLLEGQLEFMQDYFQITAISADKEKLEALGVVNGYDTFHVEMTRQITPLADILAAYKLYKYLKKEKPSIVHTHTPKAGILGMLAAWMARIPNRLHTVAGLPLMEATGIKRSLLNFIEKLTYRFATQVYPNSKGLYDFILAENFTSPSKLKIIGQGSSNGIDIEYFHPSKFTAAKTSMRQELNIPQDSFVFVFVGRLVGDKGINELVTAFQNLNASLPTPHSPLPTHNSQLLLVGPLETELDPLKPETLAAIETNSKIHAVGYQADVRPYFAAADALVFPSYREGFPNVVMQAGAMGLPSIVSDINGCNEIILPGKNGIIIPPKNTEALQQAMQDLSSDTKLYTKLKSNSREMIVSRYSRKEVWDALLEEYRRLLD